MKIARREIKLLAAAFFGLVVLLAVPAISLAQGRGHGNGRGRGSNWDKKCEKFVNCHDARAGRWDGRGPRRTVGTWRNGIFFPRGTNVGYRNRYDTNDYWRRRHVMDRRNNLDSNWRYRTRTWRTRY